MNGNHNFHSEVVVFFLGFFFFFFNNQDIFIKDGKIYVKLNFPFFFGTQNILKYKPGDSR